MKIQIASDMHIEFEWNETRLVGYTGLDFEPGTDILILAGDIGIGEDMAKSIFRNWPRPSYTLPGTMSITVTTSGR